MRCDTILKKKLVSQPVPLSPAGKQSAHPPNCYCRSHYCSSVVADDQSAVTRHLIQRLNYPLVQSESPPQAFGKIITSSSQLIPLKCAFILHRFYFSLLPFTLFPKLEVFARVSYLCGGISYSFKAYLEVTSRGFVKHPDSTLKQYEVEEAQGYCSAALDLGLLCLFAWLLAAVLSRDTYFFPPRNQGLFQTKIDGWNQSDMVLLFSSST